MADDESGVLARYYHKPERPAGRWWNVEAVSDRTAVGQYVPWCTTNPVGREDCQKIEEDSAKGFDDERSKEVDLTTLSVKLYF
mmetsp:Transcript_10903/g.18156  ORF Transcript_10903/g.18156 Transcript_10903/m.18156 type:complete len:83 (+) Transcript_10903:486-734(+)